MAGEQGAQKPAAQESLGDAVRATLSSDEVKALQQVRWTERSKSLWAPVVVLALVFLVYLTIVEFSVCSYLLLQMPMKTVGLGCVLWWATLVGLRFLHRNWERLREARHHAEEVLADVETVANKHRGSLKSAVWSDFVKHSSVLVKDLVGRNAKKLEESTGKVRELYKLHLAPLRRSGMAETGTGVIKALAIALLVRSVFLEPFKIPSGSMLPTLEIGDQVFVNKFIYGVQLPLSNFVPFTIVRSPKRGDVIVFRNPVLPDRDYIKRVVAVGGDRLEFRGSELRVNGELVSTTVESNSHRYWDQPTAEFGNVANWTRDDWFQNEDVLSKERLGSTTHWVLNNPERVNLSDGQVTVPNGHVFVMGDNRDNSLDSRFGLGGPIRDFTFVPHGHIKGKATVIWLALGRGGLLSSIFGGTGFRTDRLFQPMELCGSEGPPPLPK